MCLNLKDGNKDVLNEAALRENKKKTLQVWRQIYLRT